MVHADSPFLSSGPRVVHDPLRSPDAEGPESTTSDVLRDLLVQKRHVLLSKLQSQVRMVMHSWNITFTSKCMFFYRPYYLFISQLSIFTTLLSLLYPLLCSPFPLSCISLLSSFVILPLFSSYSCTILFITFSQLCLLLSSP